MVSSTIGLEGLPGGDDHAPLRNAVDTALAQAGGEFIGRAGRESLLGARGGVIEEGAVLGDHVFEEVEPVADRPAGRRARGR